MRSNSVSPQRRFLLVFDKNDDVIPTLIEFAVKNKIRGATFVALGAFRSATVAYWDPATKAYEEIEVDEQVEVLSCIGNVGVLGDETKIHAHVTLGWRDGSTVGGHLMKATVFPTLEMHLVDYGATIVREKDAETGLILITGVHK